MSEDNKYKVSVVMPVYNEARTIGDIINKVNEAELGLGKEIVVVDDGSEDGTADILKEMARSGQVDLRIFRHNKNRGKGAALRTGFERTSGDIIIIQDADLEYDPADFMDLIQPILDDKADVVYGSRFVGDKPHRVLYFWHYVGNKLVTLVSNVLTNLNLTDVETCYKAFRKEVIDDMSLEEDRFGFENEFTVKAAKRKFRFYEVGISYTGRTYEEGKKLTVKDGVRALWCLVKYSIKG